MSIYSSRKILVSRYALAAATAFACCAAASPACAAPDNREPPIAPAPRLGGMDTSRYWSMAPRAGTFRTAAGLVAQVADKVTGYDANTPTFTVQVDAHDLLSFNAGAGNFVWTLDGVQVARGVSGSFPATRGVHELGLTVSASVPGQGVRAYTDVKAISIQDRLVVSLGDSLASGEGNPDIPIRGSNKYKWQDQRCHRSALSYGEIASEHLQTSDPKHGVSFLSFACSGAGTGDTGAIAIVCDPAIKVQLGSSPCSTRRKNADEGGIMSRYAGEEIPDGFTKMPPAMDSQTDQLNAALGGRMIDDLVISIGANDANFAAIAHDCASLATECNQAAVITGALQTSLNQLGKSGGSYDQLAGAIDARFKVRRVWITTYFDPATDGNGAICPGDTILADVGLYGPNPNPFSFGQPIELVGGHVSANEASWVSRTLIAGLNSAIEMAAARHGWQVVGSAASSGGDFATRFKGHGYCANANRWVVKGLESALAQGPGVMGTGTTDTTGTLHPNAVGTQQYADAVVERLSFPGPKLTLTPAFGLGANCDRGNGWSSGSQVIGRGNGCGATIGFTVEARNDVPPGGRASETTGLLLNGPRASFAGPLLMVDGNPVPFDRSNPRHWSCHSTIVNCQVDDPGPGPDGRTIGANFYLTLLVEGRHTFDLKVANAIGTDTELTWVARADWTAPNATSYQVSGASRAIIAASDNQSGVETVYYTLNGGAQSVYSNSSIPMQNGDTLEYWATDLAGNIGQHRRARMIAGRLSDLPS